MDKFTGLYKIRDATPEDTNFILSTFLRGIYYGDTWFSLIPKDIFMNNYKKVAEAFVAPGARQIQVACLPDEPNVILGYSILSNDFKTIDFVYVKSVWRGKGIGRSLVPKYPTYASHLTPLGKTLMSKFDNLIFNPFSN